MRKPRLAKIRNVSRSVHSRQRSCDPITDLSSVWNRQAFYLYKFENKSDERCLVMEVIVGKPER